MDNRAQVREFLASRRARITPTRPTVASVTLPTVSAGAGNGITALHVFAMAIGSGTPTSG